MVLHFNCGPSVSLWLILRLQLVTTYTGVVGDSQGLARTAQREHVQGRQPRLLVRADSRDSHVVQGRGGGSRLHCHKVTCVS